MKALHEVKELEAKGCGAPLKETLTTPERSPSRGWVGTALIYAALGALWIIFSGLAADLIFGASKAAIVAQIFTGWLLVGASAFVIYVLAKRNPISQKDSKTAFIDELIGLGNFTADILDRKRIEDALKRSGELYRVLAKGTSDAIFMVGENREIVSVNQAFLDLFGYSREELIGQSVRMIHPSDESFINFGRLAEISLGRGPLRVEWDLKKKDGTVFPVEGTFAGIADKVFGGHVGIIRDITERKKAYKELQDYKEHLEEIVQERTRELKDAQAALVQREKLKTLGATAAEISHEIRNPLVSIGGFARRLQKKYPDSPETEIILHETERLETMLNRLRDYLRPVDMKPRECDVNNILTDSIAMLRPDFEKNKVKIYLDFYPDLPTAHADPAILTEVFVAMVRKTLGMMESEKEITLKTYYGEHSVYVDMISPDSGKKLWDPEYMILPFEEDGEGAGISSTFRLLKEMGGTLSFSKRSSQVIFTVSLIKCQESSNGEAVHEHQPA